MEADEYQDGWDEGEAPTDRKNKRLLDQRHALEQSDAEFAAAFNEPDESLDDESTH